MKLIKIDQINNQNNQHFASRDKPEVEKKLGIFRVLQIKLCVREKMNGNEMSSIIRKEEAGKDGV